MKKSRENDQARLQHMLDHARLACQFAEGRTRDDIDSDDQFRLALDRAVEIVGEAACKITDELQAESPEIPWSAIKGIRLIIAYRYDEIDHDVLWETVTESIPPLIGQLEAILGPEVYVMKPATSPGLCFSLAIIAGGQSRRMGRDKAFVELGGKALIEHVIERSAKLGQSETILITNQPAQYAHLGLPMRGDILPDKGSLGGIYTALARAKSPDVLVLACDMPFISTALLRFMIGQVSEETDIVVPRVEGYPQGLHAIYKKTCIAPIGEQLAAQRLKIIRFYDQMRVRYLDAEDYVEFDPDGRCFTNLNTPEELAEAERLLAATG